MSLSTKKSLSVKAWIFMVVLIIETSFFSNNTSGWASLLVIMKAEGVYSDLCRDTSTPSEPSNTTEPATRACSKQNERFNLILTITWVVSLTASMLVGLLVDKFDMKIVRALGSLLYCVGVGFLALTSSAHSDLVIPGTILVHCGGSALFLCSCRATTVFREWQSLVLSILNGAMISSSVVFSFLKMLYESGIGKSYLFISVACCNIITMIITLLLHPPLHNSKDNKPSSKQDEELENKMCTEPEEGLHTDSGKKISRNSWKTFSGESPGSTYVGRNPGKELGVIPQEDPSKDTDENTQNNIDNKLTEARYKVKQLKTQVVTVDANKGDVKTEGAVAFYQEDEMIKMREEKGGESSQKKERKNVCSLMRLVASGGFIWGVVFVGLCRFRLLLFLTTFLQFIANQPGADDDTAKAYSDVWGLVQGCSLFIGPVLGLLITAGKTKGRMRGACASCFCVLTKILKLVKARSGARPADAHFSHGVKESLLLSEHAQRDRSSAPLVCRGDQDEESMAAVREIRGCILSFSINGFLLLAFGVSVLIPNVPTQVLSIVMLTLVRVCYNGAISNMLLALFPKEHFGMLYSTNCIAVVAFCTLQYPFFLVVEDCFHGDMFWPNIILLIASFGCLGLPLYLWRYMKRLQASMLVPGLPDEFNPARERVRTEAFVEYEVYERLTVV